MIPITTVRGPLSQQMRIWHPSQCRAVKAGRSLNKRPDSPENSLFIYTKYECRSRFRLKVRHLAPLDTSEYAFKGVILKWVFRFSSLGVGNIALEYIESSFKSNSKNDYYNHFGSLGVLDVF